MTDEARARDFETLDGAALEAFAAEHAVTPPPALRARVFDAVAREQRTHRAQRRLRRWRAAATGLAAAAALFAAVAVREHTQSRENAALVAALEHSGSEFLSKLAAQEREIVSRGQALRVHAEVIQILSSPRVRSVRLDATAGHAGAARVLFDPDTGAIALVGAGLPPPEPGKAYELWALRGDAPPERSGEFAIDAERRNFALRLSGVSAPHQVTGFAITLESTPGAARPGGPIVLTGAVGG
ncbi:MAG: anti-sigma factor [Myxococcota bacterium]